MKMKIYKVWHLSFIFVQSTMSRNERIKEQIGWLKVIFGILSAVLISLCGWLATHYKDDQYTTSITTALIVLVTIFIIRINKKAYNKMDELEDL